MHPKSNKISNQVALEMLAVQELDFLSPKATSPVQSAPINPDFELSPDPVPNKTQSSSVDSAKIVNLRIPKKTTRQYDAPKQSIGKPKRKQLSTQQQCAALRQLNQQIAQETYRANTAAIYAKQEQLALLRRNKEKNWRAGKLFNWKRSQAQKEIVCINRNLKPQKTRSRKRKSRHWMSQHVDDTKCGRRGQQKRRKM